MSTVNTKAAAPDGLAMKRFENFRYSGHNATARTVAQMSAAKSSKRSKGRAPI
jgi:hypothetical protein